MTIQLTFVRGNYSGIWREDHPGSRSGSLQILFKDKEEIVLVDKAEHAAQKVFNNYCEPDWHEMAEAILSAYQRGGTPFYDGLEAVADNPRHIEHDVYVVRKILKDLLVGQGFDPGEFSEFDE